jgi:PAS domain S-box-containing protein
MTATTRSAHQSNICKYNFLKDGGEMGGLIEEYDWNESSLGPISSWPSSLCTTLGIILHSGFPQFFFWGKDLICFYNDAFRPSLGINGKHSAIGKKGKDVWPEIWDFIGPLIEKVMSTGEYVKFEDQLVPFYRNGKIEDIYWTFSYSPAYNDEGDINGVYVTCTETTQKVINFKQLEESKNQLEFAIEATELGTWDYNPTTGKFTGNHRLKEWFGLTPEDEIDLTIAINAIAEKDRKRVNAAINAALDFSSGGYYNIEYTIENRKTNSERIVCAKGRTWFNDEQMAYRFNGTLQDITVQRLSQKTIRQKEDTLKQTQERLKLALSAGALATYIWDIPSDRMYPDENMCKLFGKQYPMEEGMPLDVFVEAIHPDDIPSTLAKVKKVIETGEDYKTEYRVKGIDGKYKWVLAAGKVEYADENSPKLFSGFLLDITDRKRTEEALAESEAKFRRVSESNMLPLAFWTVEGTITEGNDAFLDMLGYTKEDLNSGKIRWKDYVVEDEMPLHTIQIEKALSGNIVSPYEAMLRRKDGKIIYTLISFAMMKDGNENGIIFLLDITDKKQAEFELKKINKELKTNNDQLKKVNTDLDNFIYTASHDLKAPVSNIEGLVISLRSHLESEVNVTDDDTNMLLQLMEKSINRFKATILDLTEITKAQKEQEEDILEVNLSQLIEDVKISIYDKIADSHATIITNFSNAPSIKFSKKKLKKCYL